MATGLRTIGFGPQVDELELAMNRSAERSAGEAADVFLGAIRSMTFADARSILDGGTARPPSTSDAAPATSCAPASSRS